MDNAGYAGLTRQAGLRSEMQVIANNIANVSTDGFQREGVLFSEFVTDTGDPDTSLSMAAARGRTIDRTVGQLSQTGGDFDFAIQGDGYFTVQTPDGDRLTRAGGFAPNQDGLLSTADGALLLDDGGAPIFIPPGAQSVTMGADGTFSIDGAPAARVGVSMPDNPDAMTRSSGVRFDFEGEATQVEDPQIAQGFLESSNVDAVLEVARMIEVQRAYESGKNLLSAEHERIRSIIETLGR